MNATMNMKSRLALVSWAAAVVCATAVLACVATSWSQTPPAPPAAPPTTGPSDEVKMEYKANDMINKGLELLEMKQEERGLKLILSVPDQYPRTKARFKAYLAASAQYAKTRQYEMAIRQLAHMAESESLDEQAEGLYQTGICYYNLNQYDNAFVSLRKVTTEFPTSVFANESYYYIGLCHSNMRRWAKAIEALEMVGTSVPADQAGQATAEAGQRLYIKVHDKDLVVLRNKNEPVKVTVSASSGDKETVVLEPLGRSGEYYIGSIQTVMGEPKIGDGLLQLKGGDTVTAEYLDANTESGQTNVIRVAKVKMASTAVVGFTDGAYRDYVKGVFADNDVFMRVKDLDRDVSPARDTLKVIVYSQYKKEKEDDGKTGVEVNDQPEYVKRDQVEVTLTESDVHSGVFVGSIKPQLVSDAAQVNAADNILQVMKGDELVMEYVDEAYVGGTEPRTGTAKAKLLVGQIQDVKIVTRKVDDLELKARKNLIEARIFLKLGQVFKDVGLAAKANEKATEGLDRAQEVINASLKESLDRKLVEEAFSIKWDLLLVQDKLGQAIEVCNTLMQLFPDSALVDKALLKIGMAKAESSDPVAAREAINVFNSVLRLPKSELKADAQFQIALLMEKLAVQEAEQAARPPVFASAMLAFKKCADSYPNSPVAGDALAKIADYYISTKDYARSFEFMERVFQDYPDAGFLDKMLYRWGVAAYRSGDINLARQKFEQLVSEYPQSAEAAKARGYLEKQLKK